MIPFRASGPKSEDGLVFGNLPYYHIISLSSSASADRLKS